MFDEWRFESRLRELQQQRENARSKFILEQHKGTFLKAESPLSPSVLEMQQTEEAVEQHISRYLVTQAERYLVALPYRDPLNDSEYWKFQPTENLHLQFVLTELGVQKVRDDVRTEIKKRWETRFIWLQPITSLLTLLIGLGGLAVAGLTLWLKK